MGTDGPRFRRRGQEDLGGSLEYGLRKRILLTEYRRGLKMLDELCDAHPDLLRAAKNKVGRPAGETCPICEVEQLWLVTYIFGKGLPPGGSCPSTSAELQKLLRRPDEVTCFDVEVCRSCAWHHLVRRYPAGGITPRKRTAP
ncbi:MAG: DUF5318 family protein [Actinomycetota bacterium]